MEGILNSLIKATIKPKAKEEVNTENLALLNQIKDLKKKIGAVKCCFNLETNFDMIDSYILELEALEIRYSFLIKQAKQMGIVAF